MSKKTVYAPVTEPTLIGEVEASKEYQWIASVQTQDGILMWFGVNLQTYAIFRIGRRRVIGKGTAFSNHFMAARTVAVRAIKEKQRKNNHVPPQATRKVVSLATWHHKYDLAG